MTEYMRFADFIVRTYPDAKKILAIAEGNCQLSFCLAEYGNRRVRAFERKPYKDQAAHANVKLCAAEFTVRRRVYEQLIVGRYPCEGTDALVQSAIKNQIPFAFIPCFCGKSKPQRKAFREEIESLCDLRVRKIASSWGTDDLWYTPPTSRHCNA